MRESSRTPHQDTSPQRPEKTITKWVVSIATFMWILVILGGFGIGKLYIDRSLEAVQQANAIHVQTLKDQLDSMAVDIDQIQVALNNTDQTLSSSGSTQENLNKKIQDLDNQLQLLAKSSIERGTIMRSKIYLLIIPLFFWDHLLV